MIVDRVLVIKSNERTALVVSFLYFFFLLSAYYVLRPIRDEMGLQAGLDNLPWLFTATFLVMLITVPIYGLAVRLFPRRRLLPLIYGFFILNILLFYLWFMLAETSINAAKVFFVWLSVFNLFAVSVFWSFMTDIFNNEQAKRLFGIIAAGGSAGAIVGPMITAALVKVVGTINMLLFSAGLLCAALICVMVLSTWTLLFHTETAPEERAVGGNIFAGFILLLRSPYLLLIAAYMLLYTATGTFAYFEQAHIIKAAFSDPDQRTQVFAYMDLAVNIITVVIQLFITGRFFRKLGIAMALSLLPLAVALGFFALGIAPVLAVLVVFQVLRRSLNYAIARPAREVLYTVVSREERYKAKSVNDTLVYRGGDAISGWLYKGLDALDLGLNIIAWIVVPVALLWAFVGRRLGREQLHKALQHK